jgi:hypothetical protein
MLYKQAKLYDDSLDSRDTNVITKWLHQTLPILKSLCLTILGIIESLEAR